MLVVDGATALDWTTDDVALVREALLTYRQLRARKQRAGRLEEDGWIFAGRKLTRLINECGVLLADHTEDDVALLDDSI